ncbi:MAG: ABC-F family ATP-binding cassette domain-containing protein [Candidatus Dojkabacteria bacterium]|nr:MAG: ABC-F family ATP-binding cassette domain-containing protein [Candidatus Dojkabacteria bacterium]
MLLELTNIEKYFGADRLFHSVNAYVRENEVIGLIGNNGVGKSTLCSIIAGLDHEFDGIVKVYPGVKIAFFKQMLESDMNTEQTVFDYILKSQHHVLDADNHYQKVLQRLQHEEATPQLLEEFGRVQENYDILGAVDLLDRIEMVLNGLGIYETLKEDSHSVRNITYHSKLKELSGGERKIVELAIILLDKTANVLILDEPTNHLDMHARAWLEEFIQGFRGSVIIVSHDRHVLNNVVNHIWEIHNKTVDVYKGNYDRFEVLKKQKYEALQHEYDMQKKELDRLEEIIAAFQKNIRLGGNYVTVKLYNATKSRLERFKKNMIAEPPKERAELKLSLKNIPPKGYTVVKFDNFDFGYDEQRLLFQNQSLVLTKDDKTALLGANGTGKSTLLKLILTKYVMQNQLNPEWFGVSEFVKKYGATLQQDQSLYVGPGIKIGYYSQHHSQLQGELTIRELLWQNDIQDESQFQGLIRRYHFSKETVDDKKISSLSGGEKSKLQFILLMLSGANTLLLDEPINHLDIESMKIVENVLHDFSGALVVISHDRYFLSRVINKIVYVKDKGLHEYLGTVDEYIAEFGENR